MAYLLMALSCLVEFRPIDTVDAGIGFVIAVLLTLFATNKTHTIITAAIGSFITLLSFVVSFHPKMDHFTVIDHVTDLSGIVLAFIIVFIHKRQQLLTEKNRQYFEGLFDHISSLVALYDLKARRFERVNSFGLKLLGLKDLQDFETYVSMGRFWPSNNLFIPQQMLLDIERNGYVETQELLMLDNNKCFWVLMRVDDHFQIGNKRHLMVKVTDINAQKEAELNAMKNSERLRALFDNATIGIIVTEKDGKITDVNHNVTLLFGYDKTEMIGKKVEMLLPPELRGQHETHRRTFSQHPRNRMMGSGSDLTGQKKDGTTFPVEVGLGHYELGNESFAIAFISDITERKKNEHLVLQQQALLEKNNALIQRLNVDLEQQVEDRTKMLQETLQELQRSKEEVSEALKKEKELSDLRSRFVTMVSHEFRTPLSTILSSTYLLEQYDMASHEDGKRMKHLQRIRASVAGLKTILEDMLSLGKLEEGFIHANIETVSMDTLMNTIRDTIKEMQAICKNEQVISVSFDGAGDATADLSILRNILINLLSNAVKFSDEDKSIEVQCHLSGRMLTISVKDEGIGISTDDMTHLFQRFYRGKNAANIQGTGLGLHIVSKYLELMNGDISIKSELNKGTTVTVQIPQPSISKIKPT